MGNLLGMPSILACQSREIAAFTWHRKVPLVCRIFELRSSWGFVRKKPNEDKLGNSPRQVMSYVSLGKLNKFVIIESEIIMNEAIGELAHSPACVVHGTIANKAPDVGLCWPVKNCPLLLQIH
jgi:hypothetical protein